MKAQLIVVASALLRVVPVAVANRVAGAIGSACWLLLRSRRRTLLENLRHTAPEASSHERRRLSHATFRQFGLCTLDLLRAPHLTAQDLESMVEVRGRERLDAALASGRGALIAAPHLGAIELGGRLLTALGYDVAGYAEDAADPRLRDVYRRYRSVVGVRVLPLGGGALPGIRWLRRGGLLVLFADRAIGTRAHLVRFCGGLRPVPAGVAVMARLTGAPVLLSCLVRQHGAVKPYLCTFEGPLALHSDDRDEFAATQTVADGLSTLVRRHPDQWFVFQPAWQPEAEGTHDGAIRHSRRCRPDGRAAS